MKRTLVSLAAVAALALTGCGSDGGNGSSGSGGSGAGQSQSAQPIGKVGDTMPATELAERTEAAMKKAGTAKMTTTGDGSDLTGELDYSDGLAYRMSGTSDGEPMEMVYVDKILYMGGDSFAEMTGGKKFIKIDPEGEDLMSKMMGPLLGVLEQAANPSSMLAGLDGVDSTVVAVEGDKTTYETKMTAAQLKAATEKLVGGELPPEAAKDIKDSTMLQTVDGEGRLTKVEVTGGSGTTVNYTDHGAPVSVEAPPASEVGTLDLDSMMKEMSTP
jgi:hypothetical protein